MFNLFDGRKRSSVRIIKKGENKLKIICVDDHKIILSNMTAYVKDAIPMAEVFGFDNTDDAISFAREVGCDILFTEIELYEQPHGLELARKMQELNPKVNIIFTTVCSEKEYAEEVVKIRPSGYLTKVVTRQDVQRALQHLLYAVI